MPTFTYPGWISYFVMLDVAEGVRGVGGSGVGADSNLGSSAFEADALSTRPKRRSFFLGTE